MGKNCSKSVRPELIVDSNEDNNISNFKIHRRTTDTVFFTTHLLALVLLCSLLFYCIYNGNIFRIINGYDSCRNICGQDNTIKYNITSNCKSRNMKDKPYILIVSPGIESEKFKELLKYKENIKNNSLERICVGNCTVYNYHSIMNRCLPKPIKSIPKIILGKTGISDFFEEVGEDIQLCWPELLYICLISLAFSVLLTAMLRHFVDFLVWLILISVCVAFTLGTAYLWILWQQSLYQEFSTAENTRAYLVFAVILTMITICIFLIILVMRKQIKLVIQLFKEAGKAVTAMPFLLLQPTVTFICVIIFIVLLIYFSMWIESAGFEKENYNNYLFYEKNAWIYFSRWYNIFMFLWMIQFSIGCQHMIIAGAVSMWYFTRNKNHVDKPVFHSLYILLRYHLGSISLGSVIIAVIQFVRIILGVLQRVFNSSNGKFVKSITKCCHCWLFCLENTLKYMTRNAYIEIAIHGYSFCKAGRQAFAILLSNALRVTTINSMGDFVLFLGKIFVIVITVLIGTELLKTKEGIIHLWVILTLTALVAYLISHCFLSVYEMIIDTIFICFCEDCNTNDGISRPYYMSKELMEFVENSKGDLKQISKRKAWKSELPTISSTVAFK